MSDTDIAQWILIVALVIYAVLIAWHVEELEKQSKAKP